MCISVNCSFDSGFFSKNGESLFEYKEKWKKKAAQLWTERLAGCAAGGLSSSENEQSEARPVDPTEPPQPPKTNEKEET